MSRRLLVLMVAVVVLLSLEFTSPALAQSENPPQPRLGAVVSVTGYATDDPECISGDQVACSERHLVYATVRVVGSSNGAMRICSTVFYYDCVWVNPNTVRFGEASIQSPTREGTDRAVYSPSKGYSDGSSVRCRMFWTVTKGQTLSGIAEATGSSIGAIQRASGIADPNYIQAGASLCIP